MRKEDIEYLQKFGDIPDDLAGRLEYISKKRSNNPKFIEAIEKEIKRFKRVRYKTLKFTMWKIVKPSARPRFTQQGGYTRAYVPHAKQNGDWFESFAKENNLPYIDTPCILNMDVYEKTPSGFNMVQTILAELGFIRPWKRTGDFDNYAKGIADAIQHGMLADDYLVIESTQRLFYSIKPHADIEIRYMIKHPMPNVDKKPKIIETKTEEADVSEITLVDLSDYS